MIYSRKSSVLSNDINSIFSRTFGNVGNVFNLTLNNFIKKLFENNEQGFFYDPNDLTTMFQDAEGTVPVTGEGQPVGLVLDKSKGFALGVEGLTNGNFANGKTGWTDINGWWSIVGGRAYHPASSVYNEFKQSVASMANRFVKVSFDVQVVQGVAIIGLSAANVSALTFGVGTHTVTMYALPSATSVFFASRVSGYTSEFYIDNVSVKEVKGNHAYQTNAASRPLLQRNATTGAYYLAFDGSDDFLVTNSIDFTATDKLSLFAGVRKLSDVAGMICELSNTIASNAGSFTLVSGTDAGGTGYNSSSRGSAAAAGALAAKAFTYTSPESAVLSASHSISGSLSRICRNGVYGVAGVGNKGTGNFGNYPLYIGRRGGTSIPFNGHLYSLIGVARLSTDTETTAVEKAIAKNVGVTL